MANSPRDLSGMTRLSQAVYHLAKEDHSGQNTKEPELIILATWTQAKDSHIAKYVAQYRSLYPSSSILVTKCDFSLVLLPIWIRMLLLRPAVYAIQSVSARSSNEAGKEPRILCHIFSNGGLMTAMMIRTMLMGRSVSPDAVRHIPRHRLILESCPGSSSHQAVHTAMMAALPPSYSIPAHILLYFIRLGEFLRGRQPWVKENALLVNEPRFREVEVQRVYIYGTGDTVADWRGVERHADLARRIGFEVRTIKFEGGRHVANVHVDKERYWGAIKTAWEGEVPKVKSDDVESPRKLRASL